ncbi:MAG: hypothetical protein Q8R92_07930 [Deltaproteobacteria bacterium]|nr:hypothetical protein [Deltaproteobacteria bacterium]
MAEDTLVKNVLTEGMMKAGADLVRKLDEVEWPVFAAFWLYLPEVNTWKLVLASPRVALSGPRQAYESIQTALATLPDARSQLALSDIEVVDPRHYLVSLLRTAVSTGPTVNGIRFTRNVINGHLIHDAYIYRVSDRAPGGQAA